MLRQRGTDGAALLGAGAPQRRIALLLLRFGLGDGLFEVLQRQVELVGIELLRAPAELHALKLAKQVAQPVVLRSKLIAFDDELCFFAVLGITLGPCRCFFAALGIALSPRRDEHRA